jgi:cyclic beta-1,2-glucan synthetase
MEYIFLAAAIFLIAYLNIFRKYKSYRNIYQSVNDALLSNDELMNHAREIAKYHSITKQRKGYNYLFTRLQNNYKIITEVYKSLNRYGKMNQPLCPASEWLLDNFYIIEEQYKELQKNIDNKFYKKLYMLSSGQLKNCPRIFAVALEIVSHTDGRIDKEQLTRFINSYQNQSTLSMSELWALAPMIKMALIEKIAHVCENINFSQEQWNKAQGIKNKSKSDTLTIVQNELSQSSNAKFSFIEHLLKIFKKMETGDEEVIKCISDYLLKFDTDIERVVNHEHQEQASFQVTIGNCITSIRLVISLDWEEIFDSLSIVEKILSSDPAHIYSCMDNDSRTYYRKQVERIASYTNVTETMVARKAVNCALQEYKNENTVFNHIGYYIIGKGKPKLYKELSIRNYKCEDNRKNFILYFLSILIMSVLITNYFAIYAYNNSLSVFLTVISILITIIPASEFAITFVNWIITHTCEPSFLPKLEFRDGIPEENSTLVVVPTIFPDIERIKRLFEKLEITYLSNREKNIRFALLGDLKDAENSVLQEDNQIIEFAIKKTAELNHKYTNENDSFYLFI